LSRPFGQASFHSRNALPTIGAIVTAARVMEAAE
jgi:hypothetical protein